ncbi:unnamed protein product [Anisakis simplex]|uniref:dTDP-D-glucose 4,6-dehydratase (inferred by orthology to a human protein) n=1 Tax=Anisakis simplex TaxID=6269 RepID=A0A0M3JR04_ANISI|nr:unnamed protein product [Anisakis simplex]
MGLLIRKKSNYLIIGGYGSFEKRLANVLLDSNPECFVTILQSAINDSFPLCSDIQQQSSERLHFLIGEYSNENLIMDIIRDHNVSCYSFIHKLHEQFLIITDVFILPLWNAQSENTGKLENIRTSLCGITHFLEAIRTAPKLDSVVFMSSEQCWCLQVFGKLSQKTETGTIMPITFHAATLGACEAMINSYVIGYNLPIIIARTSSKIFGATISWNTITQSSTQSDCAENVIDVRDVIHGLLACANKGKPGEIYHIGGEREVTLTQLKQLLEKFRSGEKITDADLPTASMSVHDTYKQLGWRPQISLLEAVKNSHDQHNTNRLTTKVAAQNVPLKFLVYGARGWIGEQFVRILKDKMIDCIIAKRYPGKDEDELILDEIVHSAPSHVVSMIGRTHGDGCNNVDYLEGGPDKLNENVRDNLYAPCLLASICNRLRIHFTYLGTGCIFEYNESHQYDGKGYTEGDYGNYSGTSYSAVKGRTDWLIRYYTTTLNARIRLPINYDLDKRNLIAKMITFNKVFDIPDSVTLLPDCLPILLDLAINRYCGTINLVNPGPVRYPQIIDLYRKLVDPNLKCEVVKLEVNILNFKDDKVLRSRAHCTLDSSQLEHLYPSVRMAIDGIKEAVINIGTQNRKNILKKA